MFKVLFWTAHSKAKMRQYGLSEARVRRVIHSPRRVEEGIAPKTVAMMQPVSAQSVMTGSHNSRLGEMDKLSKWKQEIWVMIHDEKKRRKIVSAWRYPGMTKPRSELTRDFLKKEFREYFAQNTR